MHSPKAVVFDFDYTLADSSQGACDCINFAMSGMGLQTVSFADATKTIGLSLPNTFEKLVPASEWGRAHEFSSLFVERADEVMASMTSIFPAVPNVLGELFGQGIVLGITSTKFRYRIEGILERDALAHLFQVIVGAEDVAAHKPDPSGLLHTVTAMGHSPSDSVYVGDSTVDAETAAAARIPFIGVLSGTTSLADFEKFNAQRILGDMSELPGLLTKGDST
jgi:phosphoglycolate phosphatase